MLKSAKALLVTATRGFSATSVHEQREITDVRKEELKDVGAKISELFEKSAMAEKTGDEQMSTLYRLDGQRALVRAIAEYSRPELKLINEIVSAENSEPARQGSARPKP